MATHLGDVAVSFTIEAALSQTRGFGYVMLVVALATNSLNGDRTMDFTSVASAQTAQTAGYISTGTLAGLTVGFGQIKVPTKIKVGYIDRTMVAAAESDWGGTANKASKSFATTGTGAYDATLQAQTAGTAGDSITFRIVTGGANGSGIAVTVVGSAITATMAADHLPSTTVGDVNTAIAGSGPAAALVAVSVAGTTGTALEDGDAFTATNLAGGYSVYDGTITAVTAGTDGNDITIAFTSGTTEACTVVGNAIAVTFHHDVSTVTSINALINGTTAAAALVTASGGTGSNILGANSAFAATNLEGGSGETWAEGLAAIVADDSDFYGVCLYSRAAADQLAMANAITAGQTTTDGKRVFFWQSSDATLETATPSSDLVSLLDLPRAFPIFDPTDTEWVDMAVACGKLPFDPDATSYPFVGPMQGVAEYWSTISDTQATHLDANNVNWLGPFPGGGNNYLNRGVNGQGVQFKFQVSADWFCARATEAIGNAVVKLVSSGQSFPESTVGQQILLNLMNSIWALGKSIGHFTGIANFVAPDLTSTDISLGRLIVNGAVQLLPDAVLFVVNVTGSTDPVST